MSTNSKNEKKSIEGKEELQRVDMAIDALTRELNSLPGVFSAQNEANNEWLSLLPWPITSHPIEETLLWYGIGIAARVYAISG